ncbi:MAG: molybdenum cofactor biosynthesis protein B [Hyphomicrobiales bacterium]|nr:molybdenum cofactor biosynthesis protein B [Hyphomicrobiales bacterium]
MAGIDESRPFIPVRIAVLTVSDTRTPKDDKSGTLLAEMATELGHEVVEHVIDKDSLDDICVRVRGWIDNPNIDVVLTTGGTGFTGRDVTPEAVKPLFEKEIDGFSTLFHMLSYEKIGTSTIQSRACGGVANGTYIFCVPGSPSACKDAWHGILKSQLDNRHRPCNFIEIMPRLIERRRDLPDT